MSALRLKLALGFVLGLTLAGTGAGAGDKKEPAGDPAAMPKRVRVPSPQDGILFVVGTEAKQGAPGPTFKVRVGEEVREYRRLRVGDKVGEGQMLAQLDDRLARNEVVLKKARLTAAEAESKSAEAMAKEAQARLDRLDRLRRTDARLGAEEYSAAVLTRDKHRDETASKKAAVKVAQLELERAQTVLEMYTIRSPVSGVLRAIRKHRGEAVRKLETVFEIEITERD
jgi:multidrug efflux pump subunit AcrA (membrane-fusion protein)